MPHYKFGQRLLALLVLVTGFMAINVLPASAQNTSNFTISSFNADYYIGRNSQNVPTMKVDETIVAQFPNYDQNHGILRAIPKVYKNQPLDVHIQSVTDDSGQAYHYTTSTEKNNLVLKIGNAGTYVHGQQTYHIIYNLKNEISFFDDHDELYWNVNGTQWQQSFGEVTARVHISADLGANLQDRQVCYSGSYGSTAQDCVIKREKLGTETVVDVSATQLAPGENLSFVLGFTKGTFAIDKAAAAARQRKLAVAGTIALGLPLATFIIMYRKWRVIGKDAKGRGTIIPEYTPPDGLNALTSDVLLRENFRTQAISALIIELAIKKYVAIYEVVDDGGLFHKKSTQYELELLQAGTGLSDEEQAVLKMFFGDVSSIGTRVNLNTLKNKLFVQAKDLGNSSAANLFTQGYFRSDPLKAKKKYLIWGVIFLFGAVFLGNVGFIFGVIGVGVLVGWALSGLLLLIFARLMPARTDKGVTMRDYLYGLRDYIKLAEADRLKYLQSPKGVRQYGKPGDPNTKIKLFEKLLPYAMIFGLEKDWAKQFKDVYKQPPDWYHGNWSTFNTIYLVNSLGSFNTMSTTSFTSPHSSGSSGFGGGGFSGGGGGGGGGGGW